jgi:Lrp/AsnC family transcriptional regulator, leucine-responsive regulatory protein
MSQQLDKKDRLILYQLDLDSRQSFNQIGKKTRLRKEVVQYRVARMEREGIIKGYYCLIDVSKLGYFNGRFFIKFQRDSPEEEQKIIDYYKTHPRFWWVDSIDGFRDLGLACWVKNIHEFYGFQEDLIRRFGRFINEVDISFYHKFYQYKRTYLSQTKEIPPATTMFFPERTPCDEQDLAILRSIGPAGRKQMVDIAQEVGLSTPSIISRMKNLEKEGVIKGYKVLIDLQKIGYYWYKIEFQLENPDIKKSMLAFFHQHPNIIYAYETVSANDLEVELEVESYEHFRKILNEIRQTFSKHIKKYHHLLWYKEHKFQFVP